MQLVPGRDFAGACEPHLITPRHTDERRLVLRSWKHSVEGRSTAEVGGSSPPRPTTILISNGPPQPRESLCAALVCLMTNGSAHRRLSGTP